MAGALIERSESLDIRKLDVCPAEEAVTLVE